MAGKDYNKSVRELFGLRPTKGEVGIEIEVEGTKLIHGAVPPYWDYHQDHSLRGPESAEYVLAKPVEREEVRDALHTLFGTLDKHKATLRNNSPNASVHVHLNVQGWSLKQVYGLSCLWYMFEDILMEWCGDQRVGNLFCLRASDAEAQLLRLASAVRYGRYSDIADQEGLRYAALNYTALSKFGSLEFRGYPSLYEADKIHLWVKALLALKDFAQQFESPPDIIAEFSRSGAEDFFKTVLSGNLWKEFETKTYMSQLRNGMRLVQNVAYCVNWEKADKAENKKKDPLAIKDDWDDLVADAPGDRLDGEPEEDPRVGRGLGRGHRLQLEPGRVWNVVRPQPGADVLPDVLELQQDLNRLPPEVPPPMPNPVERPRHIFHILDQTGRVRENFDMWIFGGLTYRNHNGILEIWDNENWIRA